MLLVDRREDVVELADALATAEKKIARRVQAMVQEGQDSSLQLRVEVDEDVATADEVEFGERRIPREIVPHEHAKVADLLADAVAAFRLLEEPSKPLGADPFHL